VSALKEIIREHIATHGPVTFRWFMEQALYHPQHGYYASGKARIGKHGDFFTNVSIGPLFGELLAAQFREMWERMDKPDPFTIVEQGANNGDFAKDVLIALRRDTPDFFQALRYVIVEPFEIARRVQRERLGEFPLASWRASLAEMEPFRGVHFSNELLDAMPVHLVTFTGGEWREKYVDAELAFTTGPLSNDTLRSFTAHLPRIENYETEINLDAPGWIRGLAEKITRGYVLTIDYGYPRDIFYSPDRRTGTLACHRQHRRGNDPLEHIGDTDITAHVDFTSLAECAAQLGFECAGFTDQHHFMVGLGKDRFRDSDAEISPERQKELRAFNALMHPGVMGLSFKVLALQKNIPQGAPLRGFQFAPRGNESPWQKSVVIPRP
jgi:SAM-dependent MidA family methyltransferase